MKTITYHPLLEGFVLRVDDALIYHTPSKMTLATSRNRALADLNGKIPKKQRVLPSNLTFAQHVVHHRRVRHAPATPNPIETSTVSTSDC